jgi:hypothetical protein
MAARFQVVRRNAWRLLPVVAYVAYLGVPLLHSLSEGSSAPCEICRAREALGASLRPHCDEDCNDPNHHHHKHHDADQCFVCRTFHSQAPFGLVSAITTVHDDPIGCQATAQSLSYRTRDADPRLIRGPPTCFPS